MNIGKEKPRAVCGLSEINTFFFLDVVFESLPNMKIKVWGKYKILVCKDSSKIEMALVALLREKSLSWEAGCHRDDGLYLSFMRSWQNRVTMLSHPYLK